MTGWFIKAHYSDPSQTAASLFSVHEHHAGRTCRRVFRPSLEGGCSRTRPSRGRPRFGAAAARVITGFDWDENLRHVLDPHKAQLECYLATKPYLEA